MAQKLTDTDPLLNCAGVLSCRYRVTNKISISHI